MPAALDVASINSDPSDAVKALELIAKAIGVTEGYDVLSALVGIREAIEELSRAVRDLTTEVHLSR